MNNWQPIETAPKDGTWVLAAHASSGDMFIVCWRGIGWINDDMGECWPTHWQPLPEPPAV